MEQTKNEKYIKTIGRRKEAVANAHVYSATKNALTVNNKDVQSYFPTEELRRVAMESLSILKTEQKFKITVLAHGGGQNGQAVAVRHAIARALVKHNPQWRVTLKRAGFLMRDPRAKERRKFGLKKARKAPQWSKR